MKLIGCKYMCNFLVAQIFMQFFSLFQIIGVEIQLFPSANLKK